MNFISYRSFRVWSCFVVICMIVVGFLAPPAKAAVVGAYNANDYIVDRVPDGDNLVVTMRFDDTSVLFSEIVNDSTTSNYLISFSDSGGSAGRGFNTARNTSKWLLRMYLGGVRSWADYPAPANGVFYVGDIMPGASINVSCGFHFDAASTAVSGYPLNDATIYFRIGMFYYDADGDYLGRYLITETTKSYDANTTVTNGQSVNVSHDWTLDSNVAYILPFYDVDAVLAGGEESRWNFVVYAYPFEMTTSINMIYKDSLTMDSIKDELGVMSDTMDEILGVLDKEMDVDVGSSDFSSVGDGMSTAVDAVSGVMSAGSSSVSDLADSSVMGGTLTALASGLSVAFSDDFQITLCGMTFNPFEIWVTVIGGFSLIVLMVAYIFRKRGGGDA